MLRLYPKLCDGADIIVVEDLHLIGLSRGMLGQQMLDAGHGQFLNAVLPWVAMQRRKAVVKEDARGTSHECPDGGAEVRKALAQRWHSCDCGCSMPRDLASGKVLVNRYIVGSMVLKMPLERFWRGMFGILVQTSVHGELTAIHAVLAG